MSRRQRVVQLNGATREERPLRWLTNNGAKRKERPPLAWPRGYSTDVVPAVSGILFY